MKNNSELYKKWMNIILYLSEDVAKRNLLYAPYKKYGVLLDRFLEENNLPAVKGGDYIAMWEGIKK